MAEYKITVTPYQLLEFKYKVLRELKDTYSEEQFDRYKSLQDLLFALEHADDCTVILTQPQILRLAFLTLWDMEHMTEFDANTVHYQELFQTLEVLGVIKDPNSEDGGWLIPKVYKALSHKPRKKKQN